MKKQLLILMVAVISCCFGISCDEEDIGGKPKVGSMEDLVGTYSVKLTEDVIWGGSSGTTYDIGTVVITKLSDNRVQLSGFISTQGMLVDGELYLDSQTHSDSYGYTTTTYTSALFGAGILTEAIPSVALPLLSFIPRNLEAILEPTFQ